MEERIKKFINYIQSVEEIDLYGQEWYIGNRLFSIMEKIKENDYRYNYKEFGGTELENVCMLYVFDNFRLLEWGTSIRIGWIDHGKRDIFDILIKLLEKNPDILSFKRQYDKDSGMWYKIGDEQFSLEDDIKYLTDIINDKNKN